MRAAANLVAAHVAIAIVACLNPFSFSFDDAEPPVAVVPADTLSVADLQALGRTIDEFMVALQENPGDVQTMSKLAMLHMRQGWYEDALGPLARAVELAPGVPELWNTLGVALERSARLAQALEAYRKAVGLDVTYVEAVANLARAQDQTPGQGGEQVDLAALARAFVERVEMWGHGC